MDYSFLNLFLNGGVPGIDGHDMGHSFHSTVVSRQDVFTDIAPSIL